LILLLATALSGQSMTWTPVVAVIAALTMTAGNLLALRQRSAVRLLAWSSVAQSGYILAPLAVSWVDVCEESPPEGVGEEFPGQPGRSPTPGIADELR
jgi:NADH-quinone oxidoreductase subunit N